MTTQPVIDPSNSRLDIVARSSLEPNLRYGVDRLRLGQGSVDWSACMLDVGDSNLLARRRWLACRIQRVELGSSTSTVVKRVS